MIRNAVIHINNEQPLLADLYGTPSPSDVALVCTNLRTMSGTRPIFIDRSDSVFLFPLLHIRFVEIPPGSDDAPAAGDMVAGVQANGAGAADATRRHGARGHGPEEARDRRRAEPEPEPEPAELELDEDLLRRVREL